jgi:hypothetical protein
MPIKRALKQMQRTMRKAIRNRGWQVGTQRLVSSQLSVVFNLAESRNAVK